MVGVDEPHELLAVTDIAPPAVPTVALIVNQFELPLQPEGNVQVNEVAPELGTE